MRTEFLVYNHVLRLELDTLQWTLVDNYGDIPGVRMGQKAFPYLLRTTSAKTSPRPHCLSLAGLQTPCLRWRERTP